MADRTCTVEGCDRPVVARELCNAHLWRLKVQGDVQADKPIRGRQPNLPSGTTCSIEDCNRPHFARGLCSMHRTRLKQNGSTDRSVRTCAARGCKDRAGDGVGLVTRTATLCKKHRRQAYRKANPDIIRANIARRKARKRAVAVNDLTAQQWRDIKAAYRHRCAYCNKRRPLTMDHVIPLASGGWHTALNVIPACLSCNCRKSDNEAPTHQPLLF